MLATRTWMERTIADVAFDAFAFGHDVLCDEPDENGLRVALERGWRADGVVLAVGSMQFGATPIPWVAAQSKLGGNHLDLDLDHPHDGARCVGLPLFDERFDLDVDIGSMEIVRTVVTDEVADWIVDADDQHGPLIVIFDGAEAEADDHLQHGSAVFLAREVADDDAFVATLALTRRLLEGFRAARSS